MAMRLFQKLPRGLLRWSCAGFLAGMLFACLAAAGVHGSSETSFCASCHEMKDTYRELQASKHWKNRSGTESQCSDCHISRGLAGLIEAKWKGLGEVKVHFLGKPSQHPAEWGARRLEMRKRLVADMPQENCTGCHSVDRMVPSNREAEVAHKTITPGMRCLDCHSVEGLRYLVHDPAP